MMSVHHSKNSKFSYSDYLSWNDDHRWELINGVPLMMSSAPNRIHQTVLRRLAYQIENYLREKTCQLFFAPFDVRLEQAEVSDDNAFHVVQPDLLVVCDHFKLDDHGCIGAPDWVIEIISPSTASHDHIVYFRRS